MSYRILVRPSALRLLRSFSDHVVRRVGHLLAELAELAGTASPAELAYARPVGRRGLVRLDVDGAYVYCRVDAGTQTVELRRAVARQRG